LFEIFHYGNNDIIIESERGENLRNSRSTL